MNFLRRSVSCSTLLLLALSFLSPTVNVHAQCPTLLWSDEFDGNELDLTKWSYMVGDGCDQGICGWGNNEWQSYTEGENVQVSDGTLKITAKYDEISDKYTSARITSLSKADFDLTGMLRFEARIRVPYDSQGLWPAFWMLPSLTELSSWPSGGEIDIMEFIGREPNRTYGAMHYGVEWGDKSHKAALVDFPEHAGEYFHDFALEKVNDSLTWFVDGNRFLTLTSKDIEPKFEWPFDSVFHLILNLAVGGNWPEFPDQSTVFPSTLEIDFIRVYDIAYQAPTPFILGDILVHVNSQNMEYCIQLDPTTEYDAATMEWWVPEGASFAPQKDTPTCIIVNFGVTSGYVEAIMTLTCGQTYEFWLPVQVQDYYKVSNRFWAGDKQAVYVSSTGTYTVERKDDKAPATITYQRSREQVFDNILYKTDEIRHPNNYVDSSRKFYMDAVSETAASCTRFFLYLEDSTIATPENFPTGRHSRYIAFLQKDKSFQTLEFDFFDRPDPNVENVDQIAVLIDSFQQRSDTYILKNFVSASAGCEADCLPLSNNTCQIPAKSEEGACTDNFNNDEFGWNGDTTTDCEDSDCFGLDPACLKTTPAPTPAVEICDDGIDNDDNSFVDCDDFACSTSPHCGSWWNPSCKEYAGCVELGHVGDCCPDAWGKYKDCCTNDTPASCQVHPQCQALGLTGECCPTSADKGSVFLDCCAPDLCATNPKCSGLDGTCCPTPDGVFLECCDQRPENCVIHPQCAGLGLTGQCCPTVDGVFLDCCEDRACNVHPACAALGLGDDCCPTRDGIFLDCCELNMSFFEGFEGAIESEVVASRTP
jgi:beta-glucanase (GH16 family)